DLTPVSREYLCGAVAHGEGAMNLAALLALPSQAIPTLGADRPHVHADHSLSLALQRMGESRCDVLPVVSRQDTGVILGAVTLDDILAEYGVRPSPRREVPS